MPATTRSITRAAAAPMSRLLELPPELILHILQQLPLDAFFICASVCQTFHKITCDRHTLAQLALGVPEGPVVVQFTESAALLPEARPRAHRGVLQAGS